MRRSAALAPALLLLCAAAPAQLLAARGHWAALRFGPACEAGARPLPPSSRREAEARAGFRFEADGAPLGRFHARLSREPRVGASVILTVGRQPFLLAARGPWAFSRGAGQDAAILSAVRGARGMRVESRDRAGRRFADRYLLDGAPTAIDAAAAACALAKASDRN